MAVDKSKGYPQFEDCGENCIFNSNGKCLYEYCVFKYLPKSQDSWTFECQICGDKVTKATKSVRILICDNCLSRLKRSASCKECGNGPMR